MLAEQRDTEMGVRRRSASVASSGSRNTRSTPCKPWSRWVQPCGGPAEPESRPRRVLPGDPRSYGAIPTFAVPESGCPVVPATGSR